MDILKRSLSPITDEAWTEIDAEARNALLAGLCGRKIADVKGPFGLDHAAVALGRIEIKEEDPDGVRYGLHQVQPLIEARVRATLDVWELDNATRGALDLDLEPLVEAARKISEFEDDVIFNGLEDSGVDGLLSASAYDSRDLGPDPEGYVDAISLGLITLQDNGVHGPFSFVAGRDAYRALAGYTGVYPLIRHVERMLETKVLYASAIDGAALVSTRGGDFELTLGQDFSVGYHSHDTTTVDLYISESFTFRVLSGDAVLTFTAS